MIVRNVPLSYGHIRSLESDLKRLAWMFPEEIGTVERAIGRPVEVRTKLNISRLPLLDGNYSGGEDPNSSVSLRPSYIGYEVAWEGKQIAYLEFGTAAAGAGSPYPDGSVMAEAGYAYNQAKTAWVYKDKKTGDYRWSHGLPALAPMWRAAQSVRLERPYQKAAVRLKKLVLNALAKR